LGAAVQVTAAVELGSGWYNTTYRLELHRAEPVILRVAPEEARQFGIERHLIRNEYASVPFLTSIAPLMPRILAADFTHAITDRDYLVQTHLDGVQASERLDACGPTARRRFGVSWDRCWRGSTPYRATRTVGRSDRPMPRGATI
jgi:hypothetical protein